MLWCGFAALFLVGLVVVAVVKQWVLVWWCLILLVVVWLRERERERDTHREAVTEFREKRDCNDQRKALATFALYFKRTSHN